MIAYDLELMEKHTLKLTKEIVNKLVGGVKDYAKILEKLYIDNGDLALLDHNN